MASDLTNTTTVEQLYQEYPELGEEIDFAKQVVRDLGESLSYIFLKEIDQLLLDPKVLSAIKEQNIKDMKAMRIYSYASLALTFAGKDVNRDSVREVLKSVGYPINEEALVNATRTHTPNQIPYFGVLFFLTIAKMELNVNNIIKIFGALNISPDVPTATNIIRIFKEYRAKKT